MVKALSNIDVMKKTGCKFLFYQDITGVKNIDEFLPKTLILYQLARIGHFCCLFKDRHGTLNFFDSTGKVPDEALKHKKKDYDSPNHDFTYLNMLLYSYGEPIEYNQHRYQKDSSQVCGHWCTMRLLYSHLTNEEFYDIFKPIKLKDKLIVKLYNEH